MIAFIVVVAALAAESRPYNGENAPSCDEVRRVRAALVLVGEDDAAVRRLEVRLCRSDVPVGGGAVTAGRVSAECEQMLILQALGTQGGGDEVNGLKNAVCELGQVFGTQSRWPSGALARNGTSTWYWPNGKLAQNGANVWYWPNGKLAQNGETTWYWPNGNLAQNGATTFYAPTGGIIDQATLLQLACRDVQTCRDLKLKGLSAQARMAWFLALSSR